MDYASDGLHGWNENKVGMELSRKVHEKFAAYLNGQVGLQDGSGAPSGARSYTLRLGLKNDLTDKTTVRAGLGMVHYRTDFSEYTKPSVDAEAFWKATKKMSAFVNGRNEIQPMSGGGKTLMTTRFNTGINYALSPSVTLIVSGSLMYDQQLDGVKAKSLQQVVSSRLNYRLLDGLKLFAKLEHIRRKQDQDLGDDYAVTTALLGAEYML